MESIILSIRQELKNNSEKKILHGSHRFFKEEVKLYGVKIPVVNKISKEYFYKLKGTGKSEIFHLCDILWQSGYTEEGFIACNWAYSMRNQYQPEDFEVFWYWVENYVSNWATCDTLCNHTLGDFVMMYPEYVNRLKNLAVSDNRWVRRAAAVTLIIPARRGLFLQDILDIAEILLEDKDDLVRKGYGWMLKAASEIYQKEVFEFVLSHKNTMPRTALRYAIEKMPKEMKAEVMKK